MEGVSSASANKRERARSDYRCLWVVGVFFFFFVVDENLTLTRDITSPELEQTVKYSRVFIACSLKA